MNILLLDEDSERIGQDYKEILEKKGHNVVSARLLVDIPEYIEEPKIYLSQFDIAIVRPHWSCFDVLTEELKKRKEFRVVRYGYYEEKEEMEGRLIFKKESSLSEDNLVGLISNN